MVPSLPASSLRDNTSCRCRPWWCPTACRLPEAAARGMRSSGKPSISWVCLKWSRYNAQEAMLKRVGGRRLGDPLWKWYACVDELWIQNRRTLRACVHACVCVRSRHHSGNQSVGGSVALWDNAKGGPVCVVCQTNKSKTTTVCVFAGFCQEHTS